MMMTEGGEVKHNTNINFLLEELGVMANSGEQFIICMVKSRSGQS